MERENKQDLVVFYSWMEHDDWSIYAAATSRGLCYVGSPNKPFDELAEWVEKRLPQFTLRQDDAEMVEYFAQIKEYLLGQRTEFIMPVDLYGTAFQISVWDVLATIPHGQTNSYSDIAERMNLPKSARAVGAAIGANPVLMAIPCHRVIGKNGKLTGFRGGLDMKSILLQLEGRDITTPS